MDLDEDLTFATHEMGVEEEWVYLLNKLKQIAKQNVHGVLGEYLISYLHQNFHLGITIVVGLFVCFVSFSSANLSYGSKLQKKSWKQN
jgi:hypothetical protein